MDQLLAALLVMALLIGLGVASAIWGAESRPGFVDDHNR